MQFYKYYSKGKPIISFEIFPPKTGEGMENLRKTLQELKSLSPGFITVTYGAMGSTRERTIEIASYIQNKMRINAACHLTCVNSSQEQITEMLIKIHKEGIRNIVALRGDPPKNTDKFQPLNNGYSHANQLVEHIRKFEKNYLGKEHWFGIAVAGYPEKHVEAPSLEKDIDNLKRKVEAGADIIITQLFFDNSYFFNYVEKVRSVGITIPIVPGLMPILSTKQIKKITAMCGSKIPLDLEKKLEEAGSNNELARKIGIEQCTKQAEELLKYGVPGIHFYVLNRASHVKEILNSLNRKELLKKTHA